jgi:hypothetical protein
MGRCREGFEVAESKIEEDGEGQNSKNEIVP